MLVRVLSVSHITRAGIHNQKKTVLRWTALCSGSVSSVSTGTLSTLLNDLPPPSYLGYPPSFLFTTTRAGIHKQEKTVLSWTYLCSGSVSPVSTGTLSNLLNDLPPPSYPGYPPSFLLHITRAGIHNQKKTLLSWTELCPGSVSPVSTGTLSTLLNDLPPPSYPEYSPSFLFTITRAGIHKLKKTVLSWTDFCSDSVSTIFAGTLSTLFNDLSPPSYPGYPPSFLLHITRAGIHNQKKTLLSWTDLCLGSVSPVSTGTLSTLLNDLPLPSYILDTRPIFSYVLPEMVFITKRKLC